MDEIENQEQQTEQEGADDIRSVLSAAYDAAEAAESTDAPVETEQQKADRARDERGRFASKDQAAEPVEAASPPALTQDAEAIQPPISWKPEEKELWAKVPAELRPVLARREQELLADYTRKTQHAAQIAREAEPIRQVLAPYAPILQQQGLAPDQAVSLLMNAHVKLESNPAAAIAELIRSYNLQPEHVMQALHAPAAPQYVPPQVALLEQRLAQLEADRQQAIQAQHQQRFMSLQQEVDAFQSETLPDGNLARPYAKELENLMASILPQLRQENPGAGNRAILEAAYDWALHANPKTRQTILQQSDQKRREEATAKAQKAKQAAVSINGAPGSGASNAIPTDSIRNTLSAVWDSMS